MTISSQICKRIYQTDGTTRQWTVDFPYISTTELKVICTDETGKEADVTAQCIFDEIEQAVIYPTVASGKDPIPTGNTLTIIRVTTPTQTLHLTQQGTLDATALEKGFDKLTLQVQELQEQSRRSIKYPVSSTKSEADAQTFLNELQAAQRNVLNGTLENVRTITHDLVQAVEGETASRIEEDAALQEAILTKQNTLSLPQQDAVNSKITAARVNSYDAHLLDNKNPHNVSKMQVGLGNVDNTADMDKPVSHAMQTALNQKQATLTNAQLEAVNSGVTQEIISQVQSNQAELASMAEELDEDRPWQKPADWIDIRSGALNNSIYLLVAHQADYSQYAKFSFEAITSTSTNTYDVYVDGLKHATTASGGTTTLDWQTLALDSGYDVTYPSNLRTHVVRITPTQNTDTLTRFCCQGITGQQEQGLLWAHFELNNPIQIAAAFADDTTTRNFLLEAVTAKNDNLTYTVGSQSATSGFYCTFKSCTSLKKIPVLTAAATIYPSGGYLNFLDVPLKKVVIKGNAGTENLSFLNNTKVQEFDIENGVVLSSNLASGDDAHGASNLKKLPSINASNAETFQTYGLTSLQDTVIDDSSNSSRKVLRFYGTSTAPVRGLKGLTVSNEAPFDGESPQLNVSYTGLDRQALRQLFKSMPYNVGYTVKGSPTIENGIASGFSSSSYLEQETAGMSIVYAADEVQFFSKFTTPATVPSAAGILARNDWRLTGISIQQKKLQFFISKYIDGTATNYSVMADAQLEGNTTYYAKGYYNKSTGMAGISYSVDNINWIDKTITDIPSGQDFDGGRLRVGYSALGPFTGSIDLNETYVKLNGVPWFTGKAAMTKTCDVRGCTGTADLTAADKNIALDKNWELTVA